VSKKQNAAEDTRIGVHMSPLIQDTPLSSILY